MKNLQTGTTCLSSSTGSKQHKCERSLLRLATFVILFLCSMTVAWAQEMTTDKTFSFTQTSKTDLEHQSKDEAITATFSSKGLTFNDNNVKFSSKGTGNLTITAYVATISKIELKISRNKTDKPEKITPVTVTKGSGTISVENRQMTVDWNEDNNTVTFSSATGDLFVFGATIYYQDIPGELRLLSVTAPTITLNNIETTKTQLQFTITQTAKEQEGTTLETWYTTDGSNPNSTENTKRVKLEGTSQTVKMAWSNNDDVTVNAFTKRVKIGDDTKYRECDKQASESFKNDGSYGLATPDITPGDQAKVAANLDVTISDQQLTQAPTGKLKVYYAIDEGSNYGTVTEGKFQEATELPLKLTLKSTSTVRAYAEYTNSNNEVIKSDIVSRTYFLLDANTTYLNTSESQEVGTTVKNINGITMTYGGIKGSTNFKALSKNDDANTLGSIHTVSGKALFVNVDVESELGDGSIGKNDKEEYFHCRALSQLHEKTFALPAKGSFFKFEPEANGKLTVFVEQQGAIHNVGGKLYPEKVRKRPVYFLDETGKSIPANYAYTSSKVNKADWTKIQNTDNASNDNFYTKEYMDKLQAYYQNIIDGKNDKFTNFNSAVADADKHKALTLGTSIQPIIVLHEKSNANILVGDGMSDANGDTNYDDTGYMLISEGYVTYEFPVKAGKTYYLFASRTKLALSGFCFDKDENYKTENLQNVTLEGDKDNATTIEGLTVGKQYNVTLKNRTFGANKWYAVVLPFSVSQKQMKSVFGDGVKVLHYSDVTGTDLNLFEHFYQMIVGGTPVLVKPSVAVTNPVFNNVTLTSKKVVDIENTGFKCTGSWNNVDFPAYSYFIDAKTNSFYLYDPDKVKTDTQAPHAGAFRAWIISTLSNPAAAAQLTMHINGIEEQGETTAIWNAISGNDDAEVASKGIYSLSGQKMNAADTSSLPKGIYIVNGKKFIVK
ncbi:MAG: hypothetical protein SO214_04820 [Prevotella pectinovora]|uniref:hypothetical protein n=1 Tax=Prevotella pectinovora TaxID=1602169 RepID=UPI002A7EBB01|nr:hypothetical protein [Prevotella pectinovora]MDY4778768.1 hypothetical protein [Prevotella pectinovora]